jgi:glycosyltransferase involved in cell wall biosynthesis
MLGLPAETLLVGLVARYHPMKDHATFIQAAALLAARWNHVHMVLLGTEITPANRALMQQIDVHPGLRERMHLLGERHDTPAITAGLDIAVSSSAWGEAFRITIAEAMACGVPCVVTDVADSPWLINGTGLIVPPREPQALARALAALVALGEQGRARLGQAARQHVLEQFGLQQVAHQYEELYRQVAAS